MVGRLVLQVLGQPGPRCLAALGMDTAGGRGDNPDCYEISESQVSPILCFSASPAVSRPVVPLRVHRGTGDDTPVSPGRGIG